MTVILKESSLHITNADIEANIISELYFTAKDGVSGHYGGLPDHCDDALGLLTFCVLIFKNGFSVTGEVACASPEDFITELGRQKAREKAIEKTRTLMGYELKTKLSEAQVENEKPLGRSLILCHGCEGDCDCICG